MRTTALTEVHRPNVSAKVNKKQIYSNTAINQCKRLLKALKENEGKGVSTFFCRQVLGIVSPAARILELKAIGHEIIAMWTKEPDSNGVYHRIALYVLMREAY